MDKSRKLGWHGKSYVVKPSFDVSKRILMDFLSESGFVDSSESFLEVFEDLAKLKMVPPVPKVKVSFN